jgi:hypothetical protein
MPVTDIEKLRPELLDLSVAELERRANEIQLAIRAKAEKEEAERRAAVVAEAATHVETVVTGLKWLHDNGFLSGKVTESFTRADGQFNPATYLRAPRADDVRQARVASGDAPKRRRRVRDANGNLVPSKAAKAAGEL